LRPDLHNPAKNVASRRERLPAHEPAAWRFLTLGQLHGITPYFLHPKPSAASSPQSLHSGLGFSFSSEKIMILSLLAPPRVLVKKSDSVFELAASRLALPPPFNRRATPFAVIINKSACYHPIILVRLWQTGKTAFGFRAMEFFFGYVQSDYFAPCNATRATYSIINPPLA
jgi:hypothetical protein